MRWLEANTNSLESRTNLFALSMVATVGLVYKSAN